MTQKTRRRVPLGSPIFPNRPRLSQEEIARRKAENEAFAKRCRVIFDRVYPELVTEHYNWFILIEPDSGDYFIDPNEKVASQKALNHLSFPDFHLKFFYTVLCIFKILQESHRSVYIYLLKIL